MGRPKKSPNFHAKLKSRCITVHDWASYESDVIDDGTQSFFWRAHTLTVLFVFTCFLLYVAVKEANYNSFFDRFPTLSSTRERNIKRGIVASAGAFILFGVTQTPDGPFKRPHPVVWRFVFCVSILYELFLIFLFFQTPFDARNLLKHLDSELGKPLPEKSYGGDCRIYDPKGHPNDPWYNLKDKMDEFVPTHFIGWWFKTLILRDWWLCTVLSIMFEILEYTLEHQLPNFSECWWDHWILDVIVCNGAGIYLGMKTLNYLSMKPYAWTGLWNIPGYSGKLKRVAAQFSPYSWISFDWKPTASLKRWFATLGLIFIFLLAELNTFYLKYVLWLKPAHYLNLVRLIFFLLAGSVSMRETFQYMDDPRCKKFGRQAWVVGAIIVTELLVIYKFDPALVTKPLPPKIFAGWSIAFGLLLTYTFTKFFIVTPPLFRTLLKCRIFAQNSIENSLKSVENVKNFDSSTMNEDNLDVRINKNNCTNDQSSHNIANFRNGNNIELAVRKQSVTNNIIDCARRGLEFCDRLLGPSEPIILANPGSTARTTLRHRKTGESYNEAEDNNSSYSNNTADYYPDSSRYQSANSHSTPSKKVLKNSKLSTIHLPNTPKDNQAGNIQNPFDLLAPYTQNNYDNDANLDLSTKNFPITTITTTTSNPNNSFPSNSTFDLVINQLLAAAGNKPSYFYLNEYSTSEVSTEESIPTSSDDDDEESLSNNKNVRRTK